MLFENSEISWPRPLRFWLLLIFDVPAIIASLVVLAHLFSTSRARTALHNHTMMVLLVLGLIFQLIDITWYLDFIRQGSVVPSTPAHCLVWWFVDLGVYNTSSLIVAWMSIERHILIFHDRWVASHRRRILFHYLPLILILVYATIYYVWLIFSPPCQNDFIYVLPVCGATPCHILDPVLGRWEMGVHGCLATLIIACFSSGLLIRVIVRKHHHNQVFQWRKYRKMTIQLLSVSVLYLVFNLPAMSIWLVLTSTMPTDALVHAQLITFFLTYWVMMLLPIVSLTALADLRKRIKNLFCRSRNNPEAMTMSMGNMVSLQTFGDRKKHCLTFVLCRLPRPMVDKRMDVKVNTFNKCLRSLFFFYTR